jgi:hypothetical protein
MAILDWDGTDTQFELVQDNWIKRMRCGNWEQTWPESIIAVVPM